MPLRGASAPACGLVLARAWATVPVRSEASSAPAVTAAVSARSTLRPKPTVGRPGGQLVALQPPSGPTATTCWAAVGTVAAQLGEHDLAGVAERGSSSKPTVSATSGNQTRRHCAAASRATRRSRSTVARPARAAPAHHAALAAQRHDAVDAQLGQLLDHPLGPLAP